MKIIKTTKVAESIINHKVKMISIIDGKFCHEYVNEIDESEDGLIVNGKFVITDEFMFVELNSEV